MLFVKAIPSLQKFKWVLPVIWLVLLAFGLVYLLNNKVQDIFTLKFQIVHPYLIGVLIITSCINWGVEVVKWYTLNNKHQLSLSNAIKAVFSGITTSLFFPLRTGGFIGRFYYSSQIPNTTLVKNLILTNTSQQLITVFFGITALLVLNKTSLISPLGWLSLFLMAGGVVVVFGLYWSKVASLLTRHGVKQLLLSALRYLVFSLQLILAFKLLGIELKSIEWIYIPVYWLLISVVPVTFFGGLLVRETIGVTVFGIWLGYNEPLIVIALFLLWLMNIFIPAIVGYAFWYKSLRK